jgi:acyl CoA:acetate/3-ketoacid CoA transferase alpha subunit
VKARTSKLVSLQEAVRGIPSGASITAGGFAISHQPLAFTREMIRNRVRDLTLIGMAECWVAEWLCGAGALRRTYMSNFMLEGFGRCRRFSAAVESGELEVEDHSHFGVTARLVAAGLGLPFMPVRSMAGTDILAKPGFERPEHKYHALRSPFPGGEIVTLLSALRPEFAILHVAKADEQGNVQTYGSAAIVAEQARAAKFVIVTAEEIVTTDEIRRRPESTLLPALMVHQVVHVPYGAHPTGVYGYYDHDAAHLAEYYEASRTEEGTRAYFRKYVDDAPDHDAYLDKIGVSRLMHLRVDPALGYVRGGGAQ